MSIATAITAAQGKVANAYTAVSNKGGTLPATQNLNNLPTAINSISTGGGLIITQNFTIRGGTSWFNLGAIVDSVGYMVVGENSGGETKIIGCLFDTDGKVITRANGHVIVFDYEVSYYDEGEEAALVFVDETQGDVRSSSVMIDLS